MHINSPGVRRIDPFCFPPETAVRFALLILAVGMIAASISYPLGIVIRLAHNLSQGAALDSLNGPSEIDSTDDAAEERTLKEQALSGVKEQLDRLAVPAAVLMLMFLIALIIYLAHPGRIRRRKRLNLLSQDLHPAIQQRVNEIANQVGVTPPAVMLGEGLRSQNGQAFGVGRRLILGLDGGVRLLLVKAPARFRALLLHELAHIANRDIGPTYLSEALWRATLYVVVGPLVFVVVCLSLIYTISSILSGGLIDLKALIINNLAGLLVMLILFGIPLAVILVNRAGLLRIREFYADWRASLWGAEKELKDILHAGASKEKRRRGLRFHPSARSRLSVLENPISLFRLSMDLPFVVGILSAFVIAGLFTYFFAVSGVLLSISMASVGDLVETAFASSEVLILQIANLAWSIIGVGIIACIPFLLIFGVSYLVAGTVGLQIQREGIASMVPGRTDSAWFIRLVAGAFLITFGIELGFLITPPYSFSPLSALVSGMIDDPLRLLLGFPWLMVFFLFTLLGLWYAHFSARTIIGAHVGESPPRGKIRLLTLVHSLAIGALYFPLLVARILILFSSDEFFVNTFLAGLIIGPLLFAFLFCGTWLFAKVWRLARPVHCPSCGEEVKGNNVIGKTCANCGQEFTAWLFVSALTPKQTSG